MVAAAADQGLDLGAQGDGVEGLGHIVVRPDIQAVQGVVVLLAAADDDDGELQPPAANGLDHLEAVHAMHVYVQQEQVIGFLLQQRQSLFAAGGGVRLDAVAAHDLIEHSEDGLVVVCDEHDVRHNTPPLQHGPYRVWLV